MKIEVDTAQMPAISKALVKSKKKRWRWLQNLFVWRPDLEKYKAHVEPRSEKPAPPIAPSQSSSAGEAWQQYRRATQQQPITEAFSISETTLRNFNRVSDALRDNKTHTD